MLIDMIPLDLQRSNSGEAMNLDGLSTVAEAAASPGAATHGPAAEALLEGAEYDAETPPRRAQPLLLLSRSNPPH